MPSTSTFDMRCFGSAVILKVWSSPRLTFTFPVGVIVPFGPAVATIVFLLRYSASSKGASNSSSRSAKAANPTVFRLVVISGVADGVGLGVGVEFELGVGEDCSVDEGDACGFVEDVGVDVGEVVEFDVVGGVVEGFGVDVGVEV